MKSISLMALACVFASAVISGPVVAATTTAKLIQIHTCPITGAKVVGDPAGSEVVGKYKVFFCCGGCQPEFDKLTKAQKLSKLASLAPKSK